MKRRSGDSMAVLAKYYNLPSSKWKKADTKMRSPHCGGVVIWAYRGKSMSEVKCGLCFFLQFFNLFFQCFDLLEKLRRHRVPGMPNKPFCPGAGRRDPAL